jgi:hypothetical protein
MLSPLPVNLLALTYSINALFNTAAFFGVAVYRRYDEKANCIRKNKSGYKLT